MNNLLYKFDLEFSEKIIGVDEAGRGPLAGPVVAAAVRLKNYSNLLDKINDSKKLSEKKRENLYNIIQENFYVAIGMASVEEIDKINILNATFLAMRRALSNLGQNFDLSNYKILVDGNFKIRECDLEQYPIVKGDSKSLSIAAASIVAKVTRDRIMRELEGKYPEYLFEKHKGYGTKKHIEMIKEKGKILGVHRESFLGKIL